MRYAIRSRAAALALGLIAPLTAVVATALAVPAHAAARTESGPEVSFTGGGLGLLLCGSRPDVPSVTVGAESKIRLTNGLGQAATLRIDGNDSTGVASGETVEVQFHHGPVNIAMVPQCLLNLNPEFEQLTVDVRPAARPSPSWRGTPPNSAPPTGSTPGSPRTPGDGTGFDDYPIFDGDTLLPEDLADPPGGEEGVVGTLFESPATVVNPDGSPAKTLAGNSGPVDKGPIGLLAIIATVCVVGVSAGAIRAIVTQRANPAEYAPSSA